MTAVLTNADLTSAYGRGLEAAWAGLLSGRPALSAVDRFPTGAHPGQVAALAPGLTPRAADSLVWQLLAPLLDSWAGQVPADAELLLATTTGEIDLLERAVAAGADGDAAAASRPARLLERVRARLGLRGPAAVISAACASSTVALARAADRVAREPGVAVAVVAGDAVTEFVFAGFSALMALDPAGARPFDAGRKGLTLGDAAAVTLVLHADRAAAEGRRALARVAGSGVAGDANHMTGPAPDGRGLAQAIRLALARAGAGAEAVGSVSAHGTGTPYNDAMELKALRAALPGWRPPLYSVKGGLGHTLGAAGLVETLIAAASMERHLVPPTVGLATPDPEAAGLVSAAPARPIGPLALTTNSGFGGINAALLLAPPGGR